MQRERRNVDYQRVVPPFQKINIKEIDVDSDDVDDVVVLFNETNFYTSHLTQQYYEVAQLSNQFDNQIGEEGFIQGQHKKKYDLRTRAGAPKDTTFDKNNLKLSHLPYLNIQPLKYMKLKGHQPLSS